ncbi:MAG TPA: DUF2061 domain-containing protein [Alphaproteobacteria bacterium]|nr:DUF2061 domain-containing protein [Alphaproteobacteria bacterium]
MLLPDDEIHIPDVKTPPAKKSFNLLSVAQNTFRIYGKSITWRVAASVDTFTLTMFATHDPMRAIAVVASENMTKTFVLYPLHELAWNRIPIGLKDGQPHRLRSLAKALTWRVVGSADTLMLTWFYTGQIKSAAFVAGTELFTKVPLYYLHERLWKNVTPEQLWEKTAAIPRALLGKFLPKTPTPPS